MKSHRLQKMRKRPASVDRAKRLGLTLAHIGVVALVTALGLLRSAQSQHLPDLVTPNVLRVCADSSNMPFTNREEKGFENRIATILADELKVSLRYYWTPQGPGFVRNSLNATLCDVIIGYTSGADIVQNSNAYYRSVYTALINSGGELSGLKQLSDPRLRSKRIGVIAATPPVDHLETFGLGLNMKSYALLVDRRFESPAEEMIADLVAGRLDVAILWGPSAGYGALQHEGVLTKVPLVHEAERPPLAFRITLGIRPNEIVWKRVLNTALHNRQAEINRVLLSYGVALLDDDRRLIEEPTATHSTP